MLNRYPAWKYVLLIAMIVFGVLYALPNVFGDDPAVQISHQNSAASESKVDVTQGDLMVVSTKIKTILEKKHILYKSIQIEKSGQSVGDFLVRFHDASAQIKARDAIKQALGANYTVALNLAARTPHWLTMLGAHPMKLGLDLQGGVHFLLNVDSNALLKTRQESDMRQMAQALRKDNVRYAAILQKNPQRHSTQSQSVTTGSQIMIGFRSQSSMAKALEVLKPQFHNYLFRTSVKNSRMQIVAVLTNESIVATQTYAVNQAMQVLRKRVDALGTSAAIVQRQGASNISVDLPGVQDAARAKNLIGKTATLSFQLVDTTHDVQAAVAGAVPFGSKLYHFDGQPVLLKSQAILTGDSITYADASFGENGKPDVNIRLGGGGESLFNRVTGQNIGKPLAVVYVETKPVKKKIGGKVVTIHQQHEKVINIATIQSALGGNFQITSLSSQKEAQNLALLLRSGALQAPLTFVEETTVGPSLGKANIDKGLLSMEVGSLLVIIFMLLYYRFFGLVANMALILNVVFIVAVMSLMGFTMTLDGIAGIVLTVGMAVDANVLINERIREELRNGVSIQAAIFAGYERAFATIVDANVTTLIVAVVLVALGSSQVKGFAIALIIGLLTSMITAVFCTRAVINAVYGGKSVKQLSIGIKV